MLDQRRDAGNIAGEQAGRVLLEVAFQIWDQRKSVGKVALKQGAGVGAILHGSEARIALIRQEQGDRESMLVIG